MGAGETMTATTELVTATAAVNLPISDEKSPVTTGEASRHTRRTSKRPLNRQRFKLDGKRWTPMSMSLLSLKHGVRNIAATFKQLASWAWAERSGKIILAWEGLAELTGKATSTVRAHVAEMLRVGVLQLVDRGGGRMTHANGRTTGKAHVFSVTDLGWKVARMLAPWPTEAPECPRIDAPGPTPEHATPPMETQPSAFSGPSVALGYLPETGTYQDCVSDDKERLPTPPTPPSVSVGGQAPESAPPPTAAPPGGSELRCAPARPGSALRAAPSDAIPAPDGASNAATAAPTSTPPGGHIAKSAPNSTSSMPTGKGWSPSKLERWLVENGAPAAAISRAVNRAMAPGIGAPLRLAWWYVTTQWPKDLRREAERSAELKERERVEEETRAKIQAQLAKEDAATWKGCAHQSGPGCKLCQSVVTTGVRDWISRLTHQKKPRSHDGN